MNQALKAIKESINPANSTLGYFLVKPTDSQLKTAIPNELQRNIYKSAFMDLELMNLNFTSVAFQLLAYSKELAGYFILTEQAGEESTTEAKEGSAYGDRINPALVLADRKLKNAMALSKALGIDPYSRQRMISGPEPIKAEKSKKKQIQDKI